MTKRKPIVTVWTILCFAICYYLHPENIDILCFGFLCYYLGRVEVQQ